MTPHERKIAHVVDQLRAHQAGRPVSLRKRAVRHQVPKRNDKTHTDDKIDVCDLDAILSIDEDAMTCIAEPGVTFEALVAATLPLGHAPVVVPELSTITIGGAVAGCSIESMSFRYGGFHDSCLEYEVITSDGRILVCTPENEHRAIFQMIHGSFGTLGVLSKLTFRLVPAKPFVHLAYERYATLAEYKDAIEGRFAKRDVDFMDGIIHSPSLYVLSLGRFVDRAPYTSRYDWTKVYYETTAKRDQDYLRTRDYFFRYDNGVTNPNVKSRIGRLLFGKLIHSAQLLRLAEKLHHVLRDERPNVTLDVFVPVSRLGAFLHWHERAIGHYPLWVVPYRLVRRYDWVAPQVFDGIDDELYVDIAIYGMKQPADRNLYKEIEDALPRFHAIKTLISHNYYDERTFWSIFNEPAHRAVKAIVDPKNVFRDLYSKTCRAARGLDDAPAY
jgi:FAD/FMN-containing dehydrogenase